MRFITPIILSLGLAFSVSAFTCPDSEMALCCKSFTVSGGQKLGNDFWPEIGVPVTFALLSPKATPPGPIIIS
ncbi:hypothetical protein MMC31_006309 [Peltigera leucophlebia]|nr:hypothetical protein [Peltigera leucophlebia]